MSGLECSLNSSAEVILHDVEIDGAAQLLGERRDDHLSVIAGSVELAVHGALYAPAERVEQCCGGQRRGGHRHRFPERNHMSGEEHQPGEHPA